jgi:hypothetical protein
MVHLRDQIVEVSPLAENKEDVFPSGWRHLQRRRQYASLHPVPSAAFCRAVFRAIAGQRVASGSNLAWLAKLVLGKSLFATGIFDHRMPHKSSAVRPDVLGGGPARLRNPSIPS